MITDTPDETKQILGLGTFNFSSPSTYMPNIAKKDYENGYIKRYFISNRNYFNAIETDAKSYNTADDNFYSKVSIEWKITGAEYNVYNGKILQTTGVVDFNKLKIKQASSVIKNIQSILNNPKQFWRGY
jgi:hypothetical protein